ncbi:MAG: epoxide hydrolase family protein [Rhodanobacter sp.]
MDIQPFNMHVDERLLVDLKRRLDSIRWPHALDAEAWTDGASLALTQRLVKYWQSQFDWRAREAVLNRLPQFRAQIDGTWVHFVHQPGVGSKPLPLIMTHGWPGSFAEMEQIIPLLADPGSHGGDPGDAFHVIVPSLPGYGFSQAPDRQGCSSAQVAGLWFKLMNGLGYARFGAQGGDIGAGVSTWLAHGHPESVVGFHLNYISGGYRPPLGPGLAPITDAEQSFLDRAAAWADAEGAYEHMHRTKPQTLAYALTDSPVGLAAWMVEKFRAWSDCDGDVESVFSFETLLTDISLYWFSGNIDASLRMYKENYLHPMHFQPGERVLPPLGVAVFPRELPMPPRSWVERCHDVRRWTTMPKGGHFAALEQPHLLAEDIRAFFRPLRR